MALGDTGTVPKRKTTWLTGRAKVTISEVHFRKHICGSAFQYSEVCKRPATDCVE